jgi:uncharacterized hydrophobic protein (TIGR00271 family)
MPIVEVEDRDEQNNTFAEVYENLSVLCRPCMDFYVLIILSTLIATFGLLLNSPAVIIGAMIIAPLMDPILGVSLGSLMQNIPFTLRSLFTVFSGMFVSILLSFLIGLMFSSIGSTDELMARSRPNIMDLFVALAAGFTGGYVKIRRHISGSVYGVAIAISLIPPLCAIGLGLALGDPSIFLGASLLYLTNLACIILSGLLAFFLIDIRHFQLSFRTLLAPALSVVILAIPLVYSFSKVVQENRLKKEVIFVLKSGTYTFDDLEIMDLDVDLYRRPVELRVTVQSATPDISQNQVALVQAYLEKKIGIPIQLTVKIAPVLEVKGERRELLPAKEEEASAAEKPKPKGDKKP